MVPLSMVKARMTQFVLCLKLHAGNIDKAFALDWFGKFSTIMLLLVYV